MSDKTHQKSDPEKPDITKKSKQPLSYFERMKNMGGALVGGATPKGREYFLQVSTCYKDEVGSDTDLVYSLKKS